MDLWEGVDAVIICAGRGRYDAALTPAPAPPERAQDVGFARDCEALVRFVSHKCVLHRKPLVWGWTESPAGELGGGVEVSEGPLNVADYYLFRNRFCSIYSQCRYVSYGTRRALRLNVQSASTSVNFPYSVPLLYCKPLVKNTLTQGPPV